MGSHINQLWIITDPKGRIIFKTASKSKRDACRKFYEPVRGIINRDIKDLNMTHKLLGFKAVAFVKDSSTT